MVLLVSWLATYQWKKIIENCNSLGEGAHKVGKVVIFWFNVDPVFGELKKGKLHILKKVELSTFKEMLKKMYIIAQSCFLTYFYFAWKGTLRP